MRASPAGGTPPRCCCRRDRARTRRSSSDGIAGAARAAVVAPARGDRGLVERVDGGRDSRSRSRRGSAAWFARSRTRAAVRAKARHLAEFHDQRVAERRERAQKNFVLARSRNPQTDVIDHLTSGPGHFAGERRPVSASYTSSSGTSCWAGGSARRVAPSKTNCGSCSLQGDLGVECEARLFTVLVRRQPLYTRLTFAAQSDLGSENRSVLKGGGSPVG